MADFLYETYNSDRKRGRLSVDEIPDYITNNINSQFDIREYQKEAMQNYLSYMEEEKDKFNKHLMFNMATGSGKTLMMVMCMLDLYKRGYRNFIFIVNNTNIIEKTKSNFLDFSFSKYLFNSIIKIDGRSVNLTEVSNFEYINENDINIIFTTVQGLHSNILQPKENGLTLDGLKNKDVVLISDEAHHINALTKSKKKLEDEEKTWEFVVRQVFNSNYSNVMLEFTATMDFDNENIKNKYLDKVIARYELKDFSKDKYAKEITLVRTDGELKTRMLQALIASQYRKKLAQDNQIYLKPTILVKSKTIADSENSYKYFYDFLNKLKSVDLEYIDNNVKQGILRDAFDYFDNSNIDLSLIAKELQEDFSNDKAIIINQDKQLNEDQILLNTLEDKDNHIRIVFAVDKLNEGWDVLNLFDIIRTEETRNNRKTNAEAQLIGRGARYFPFVINEGDDKYKRKYDDTNNELKHLEELCFHSISSSEYIQELKGALKKAGLTTTEDKSKKQVDIKVKEQFKQTDLFTEGILFMNKRVPVNKLNKTKLNDYIDTVKIYDGGHFYDGTVIVDKAFSETINKKTNSRVKVVTISKIVSELGINIVRNALDRVPLLSFDKMKKSFPKIKSSVDFINDVIGNLNIKVAYSENKDFNLFSQDRLVWLNVLVKIFNQLASDLKANIFDYEGTTDFKSYAIKETVKDYSIMRDETIPNPQLEYSLKKYAEHDWFIYEDGYVNNLERELVEFISGTMEDLKQKYGEVYLFRNNKHYQLYNFKDGKGFEPDFILFLKEVEGNKTVNYQVLIEPKGEHLKPLDKWKEEFLLELETKANLEKTIFSENDNYRLIGLPFYKSVDFIKKYDRIKEVKD